MIEYKKPEPTQDQELSDVMKQIAALTGGEPQSQALSDASVSPTEIPAAIPAATLPNAPAAIEAQLAHPVAPDTQPASSTPVLSRPPLGTPNVFGDAKPHDVVQVNDRESRHHGRLFEIGAIADGQVHGYIFSDDGGKDFITVKVHEVHRIGPAKVRSQVPCSRQWLEQHPREKL